MTPCSGGSRRQSAGRGAGRTRGPRAGSAGGGRGFAAAATRGPGGVARRRGSGAGGGEGPARVAERGVRGVTFVAGYGRIWPDMAGGTTRGAIVAGYRRRGRRGAPGGLIVAGYRRRDYARRHRRRISPEGLRGDGSDARRARAGAGYPVQAITAVPGAICGDDAPNPAPFRAAALPPWAPVLPGPNRPDGPGQRARSYMLSGAEIPRSARLFASESRTVSTSVRRAADVAGSSGSTTRRSR